MVPGMHVGLHVSKLLAIRALLLLSLFIKTSLLYSKFMAVKCTKMPEVHEESILASGSLCKKFRGVARGAGGAAARAAPP